MFVTAPLFIVCRRTFPKGNLIIFVYFSGFYFLLYLMIVSCLFLLFGGITCMAGEVRQSVKMLRCSGALQLSGGKNIITFENMLCCFQISLGHKSILQK